ncbi:MAG: hypothetical protein JW981_08015 [Anaerolineae bacterium]|nr:hypothetical protein [Anaerolineae bacterium]
MKKRIKIYYKILRWSALPLLVFMWLALMTGLATFKGELASTLTLGLIKPWGAGKLHTVWLPPLMGIIFYVHITTGMLVTINRLKFFKSKSTWEIVAFIIGGLGLLQFLWLYYG